jgi:hypothetical protein
VTKPIAGGEPVPGQKNAKQRTGSGKGFLNLKQHKWTFHLFMEIKREWLSSAQALPGSHWQKALSCLFSDYFDRQK